MRDKLLHAVMFTPTHEGWGLPALFWGPPGVGKTAILKNYAKRWGMHCEVLSPGERGEGAFGVVPVPAANGKSLTYPAPDWVENVPVRGIVLVDEISTAEPALQKPMLGLVQGKVIGSHKLAGGVRVIGAGNPVDCSTGGWELALPVRNRFAHLDWEAPSADDWCQWLLSGANGGPEVGGDAQAEEDRVMKAWPGPFAKASGLVAGFIKRRPELLHKMPAAGASDLSFPTHRSWEYAVRALATAEVHALSEADAETLLVGFIGRATADEFIAWKASADLPDPVALLDGKEKFAFDTRRLDRTLAVYSACAALVCPKTAEKRKERAEALWTLLADAAGKAVDIVIPAATAMLKAGLKGDAAKPVLAKLEPVLAAAAGK
jgi:hypothetical protein